MRRYSRAILAALAAALMVPAAQGAVTRYSVDFQPLNGAFDSDGVLPNGTADLTLNTDAANGDFSDGVVTLNVRTNVSGLEDLTGVGGVHAAHIHGQFVDNRDQPIADQGDGPFFEGEGAGEADVTIADSVTPTSAVDARVNDDNFIDFFEARPEYGPVLLNLGMAQVPQSTIEDGESPLMYLVDLIQDGTVDPTDVLPSGTTFNIDTTYEFDLSTQIGRRSFNNIAGPDGDQLIAREIVVHGLTVPTEISDAIESATNTGGTFFAGVPVDGTDEEFRLTGPVAAGEIHAVPTPTAALMGLGLLGGLGLMKRPRRRRA